MQISDLKIYGTETKNFEFIIESYDINLSDKYIRTSTKDLIYKISELLGYNVKCLDINKDIQFITYKRFDDENFIICLCNILKLI